MDRAKAVTSFYALVGERDELSVRPQRLASFL